MALGTADASPSMALRTTVAHNVHEAEVIEDAAIPLRIDVRTGIALVRPQGRPTFRTSGASPTFLEALGEGLQDADTASCHSPSGIASCMEASQAQVQVRAF